MGSDDPGSLLLDLLDVFLGVVIEVRMGDEDDIGSIVGRDHPRVDIDRQVVTAP
jgi:hypothetical protein